MALEFALVIFQVGTALLLGAFYGLERKVRGYPDASQLHSFTAAFGLVAMMLLRPDNTSILQTTAAALVISIVFVAGVRSAMKSLALRDDIFANSGSDTFTLSGAMSVGAACGTGDVRSVAAIVLITTLVSILRPLERMPLQPAPTANDNRGEVEPLCFVSKDGAQNSFAVVSAMAKKTADNDDDKPKAA